VALPAEHRAKAADAWVEHTYEVIAAIDKVTASTEIVEAGERGFLLTNNPRFLGQYEAGIASISQNLAVVQRLTMDNPSEQTRLGVLHGLIQDKLARIAGTMTLARGGNVPAAVDRVRNGKGLLTDRVRVATESMVDAEEALLVTRHSSQENAQQDSDKIFIDLMIFGALGTLVGGGAIAGAMSAANEARRSTAAAIERLRLLDMLDVAPIMKLDMDRTIRHWSEGCRRLYGWTDEQAVGQSSYELLHTVSPVPQSEIDAELLRKGEWSGEVRRRTMNGAEVIILAHKFLPRGADPRLLGVIETASDVTELRQSEARLLESRIQFRSVVDAAADGIIVAHEDGRIQTVNHAALRMFGYEGVEELIDLDLAVLMPAIDAARHGEYIARHRAGAPARVINVPGRELLAVRRDGSEFPIDLSVSSFTNNGALWLTGVIRDATSRRRAETALRDSEARLRLVQQVGGIAFTDRALRDTEALVSSEFAVLYGLLPGRTHIASAELLDLIHPDDRECVAEATSRIFEHDGKLAIEFRIRRSDGEVRCVSMRAEGFLGPDGVPQRIVTAQQDITEVVAARDTLAARQEELERRVSERTAALDVAEAHLRQAQKVQALGQLAGGIAHDFNNILQTVLGAAALIEAHPEKQEKVRHFARAAICAAVRGASITQRLLSFARRGELHAEAIDTTDFLFNLREVLAHTIGTTISVGVDVLGSIPPLTADRSQLDTALINIGTNARDAMPEGGTILLTAMAEHVGAGVQHPAGLAPGDYVRLAVTDDGTGMDAAILARVAEPFYTTKPHGQGTGLGLAMAKGFAEQSGGGFSIASAPGTGTTVTMWLPQARGGGVVVASADDLAPVRVGPCARILIVDDDELVRETLAAQLEKLGFAILVAASGAEALALIESGEVIDALVSDLSMPGINGIVTIRKARALRPALPCFLLTGYLGERDALSGDNAFTLVHKPVTGNALGAQIEAILVKA